MNNSVTLSSPSGKVRVEFSIESLWIGHTFYPAAALLRAWYDGREVNAGSLLRNAATAYAMCELTAIDGGARFTDRLGNTLDVLVRLTDDSILFAPQGSDADAWIRLPEGSVEINSERYESDAVLYYMPTGKIVACSASLDAEYRFWFFDRPGDVATARHPVTPICGSLTAPDDPKRAITELFSRYPFLVFPPETLELNDAVYSEAFGAAYSWMVLGGEASDDTWMMRGEPGDFAILARRNGANWEIGGVCASEKMLTIRLEDLWRRTPAELKPKSVNIEITRDANKLEIPSQANPRAALQETFTDQDPDIKIVLDIQSAGGFFIEVGGVQ